MDCPQCGAKVPSDDLFCGKCGYAMRDHGPERVDQSRGARPGRRSASTPHLVAATHSQAHRARNALGDAACPESRLYGYSAATATSSRPGLVGTFGSHRRPHVAEDDARNSASGLSRTTRRFVIGGAPRARPEAASR
ncbi:MAG: zinc ribbon domain-containing protein [Deltaproteobacteria bacterium]|nr:MAG: zinc ribbon domain-containing protein [Deltaproteobacteria bacterium]